MNGLPKDKRTQVAEALNWLEQHFPEFNDMIYQIRQGQKAGKLKKIKVDGNLGSSILDGVTGQYDLGKDTLSLDFKPSYYLGIDNKIYSESLNEVLVHELQHAVQKTLPDYAHNNAKAEALREKIAAPYGALEAYIKRHGGDSDSYLNNAMYGWLDGVNPNFLKDPTYKKLAQEWLDAYKAFKDAGLHDEDDAMDRTNILSNLLGKSPRGNYYDKDMIYKKVVGISGSLKVYISESPESIRAHGHKTWTADPGQKLDPVIHGEQGVLKGTTAQMQRDWNNTWNKDTKNISADEWRVIEQVQGALLPPEILAKISPAEKKKIDAVIDTLKKTFNSTAGNDVLDEASQKLLREKGLGDIVDKTSQTGWKL